MADSIATPVGIDRETALRWFTRNRSRTRALFDLVRDDAYYSRPISLRHPIVFYEGHLPAFNVNTLIKKGLGQNGIDPDLERLFARGIDPDDEQAATAQGQARWPSREVVRRYAEAADGLVRDALETEVLYRPDRSALDRAEAVYTIFEHEAMHQETLLYMWHQLPYAQKRPPAASRRMVDGPAPKPAKVRIPSGIATLGVDREATAFGWDNEFEGHQVEVPAFAIDVYNVTNQDFLRFVETGGYQDPAFWSANDWQWRVTQGVEHPLFWERAIGEPRTGANGPPWLWRTMFGSVPLPGEWPVYVSHAEAAAYARWSGARLPTEAEFHRAAFGTPSGEERPYPWGAEPPSRVHGNFDFASFDPIPVGSSPAGSSAWGVQDLVGNGWEWTSTVFAPFPGFRAMVAYPEYSADFFDGEHYVMKGASPATARELVRRSFRNWFRPHYPYVYATFRCVQDDE